MLQWKLLIGTPGGKLFRPDYPTVMINLLGNILTESQALQLRKSNLTPKYFSNTI